MPNVDATAVLVAFLTGGFGLTAALVTRGNRDQSARQDDTVRLLDRVVDKVQDLDAKVDKLSEAHLVTRAEVETIRRHQLLDVLAGRDKRSWRQLLLGRNDE